MGQEYKTEYLKSHLIAGEVPQFSSLKASNNVVISSTIADKLKLSVGDKIYTYYIDDSNVRARRFKVSGIPYKFLHSTISLLLQTFTRLTSSVVGRILNLPALRCQ